MPSSPKRPVQDREDDVRVEQARARRDAAGAARRRAATRRRGRSRTQTTSCPPPSSPSRTAAPEDSETSCSEERPPASTATRQRRAVGRRSPEPAGGRCRRRASSWSSVVVVVVGVVGVVGVVCASTPTVNVTVEPLRASCARRRALLEHDARPCACSLVVACTTLGAKPAPPSAAAACVSLCPTTFGTATSLDAFGDRQVRPSRPCAPTCRPPATARARCRPPARVETCWVTVPTASPTAVSAASAPLCESPETSGTRTCAGPAGDEHRHRAADLQLGAGRRFGADHLPLRRPSRSPAPCSSA